VAMKYQQGTVYPSGKRVKMWYGKYLVYRKDRQGKEVRKHRCIEICPKANTPKWKAEQMLKEIILKETKGVGPTPTLPPDDSITFRWFVRERYIPMRRGSWSPCGAQLDQILDQAGSANLIVEEPTRLVPEIGASKGRDPHGDEGLRI
jgi:hypothetical protein